MQAHRIAASFFNDTIVLKNASVVFEKKRDFCEKFKKFPKGRKKKQKSTNPIHFHNICCFQTGPNTSLKKPALYAIKLPMLKYNEIEIYQKSH